MKSILFIILFFVSFFLSAQQQDYDIYSSVLNYELKNFYGQKLDSLQAIIIVERINTERMTIDDIHEIATDTVKNYMVSYINTYCDGELNKRFLSEIDIRRAVNGVTIDVKNQPKIESSGIKPPFPNIKIHSLKTAGRYSDTNSKVKFWEKIQQKFKTHSIFEFTKISYYGSFASLYVSHSCGELCGNGRVIVLEKLNGKWVVIVGFTIWMV